MSGLDIEKLRKFVAPEFVFGPDSRYLAVQVAANLECSHPLIVTDPGLIEAGWTPSITSLLEREGIEYELFSGVTPNPKDHEVMAGTEAYREASCDVILAIGGGSPMDCAKGIGIVVSNGGEIKDYEGVDRIPEPCPPLVCIPTTAGTSADLSQFAIISDTTRHSKMAIVSKILVPDVALIDPLTTHTMDAELTAATGMDALAHAIEALGSNASSPITDLHALEAVRLVSQNLVGALENPKDERLRSNMMYGSLHAGLAFSNASLGAIHAMAHALGGLLDLAHGMCNAILLPHVVEFNYDSALESYRRMSEALGINVADRPDHEIKDEMIERLRQLLQATGITQTLGDLGVSQADIPGLAELARQDVCMVTNPRPADNKEVEQLYAQAL